MTSVFIGATVLVVLYSLWVRRDTWWSRWEIGVTSAIALEGAALVLLSPWAAQTFGTWLHGATGLWNVQQLVGHICIIMAIAANSYHVMARLADFDRMRSLYLRQVKWPARLAVPAMVVVFVVADADYRPHGFADGNDGGWADVYWVLMCGLLLYESAYASRLLLLVRADPRAKETIELYAASSAFALAALVAQLSTTWSDADVSALVWLCACLSISIFAVGSARSWQAKSAWFSSDHRPVVENNPPQPLA